MSMNQGGWKRAIREVDPNLVVLEVQSLKVSLRKEEAYGTPFASSGWPTVVLGSASRARFRIEIALRSRVRITEGGEVPLAGALREFLEEKPLHTGLRKKWKRAEEELSSLGLREALSGEEIVLGITNEDREEGEIPEDLARALEEMDALYPILMDYRTGDRDEARDEKGRNLARRALSLSADLLKPGWTSDLRTARLWHLGVSDHYSTETGGKRLLLLASQDLEVYLYTLATREDLDVLVNLLKRELEEGAEGLSIFLYRGSPSNEVVLEFERKEGEAPLGVLFPKRSCLVLSLRDALDERDEGTGRPRHRSKRVLYRFLVPKGSAPVVKGVAEESKENPYRKEKRTLADLAQMALPGLGTEKVYALAAHALAQDLIQGVVSVRENLKRWSLCVERRTINPLWEALNPYKADGEEKNGGQEDLAGIVLGLLDRETSGPSERLGEIARKVGSLLDAGRLDHARGMEWSRRAVLGSLWTYREAKRLGISSQRKVPSILTALGEGGILELYTEFSGEEARILTEYAEVDGKPQERWTIGVRSRIYHSSRASDDLQV